MSEILISQVTNKTAADEGTGVFDVLIGSVNLNLQDQYNEGRITGTDFATVYLGALQAVLQQSVAFILGKQTADKQAELLIIQATEVAAGTARQDLESTSKIAMNSEQITASIADTVREDTESIAKVALLDIQVNEVGEKIDLVISQTASSYETIKASQDKTIRDNILNNATVTRVVEETDLLKSKDLEEIASTLRQDEESETKIVDLNHSIAIKAQQEFNLKDKNGGVIITYTYYLNGTTIPTGTTTNINEVVGPILSTEITDGTGVSIITYDKEILKSKDLLIEAQTLGFASDTKQKILKQMHDGYAVNLSIAGVGDVPEADQDAAIDDLTQELLLDIGSTVTIAGQTTVPPL